MNLFEAMRIFATVVETKNLSEAARRLHVSPPTVSKVLASLEDRYAVTLIRRTTRRISVTDAGKSYYQRCLQVLAEVEALEAELFEADSAPRGQLRVTAPTVFSSRHISRYMAAFAREYPEVQLEVILTNAQLDLVSEGIDVAIRISDNSDSSLTAFLLFPTRRVFCASSDYLNEAPAALERPADLVHHKCLVLTGTTDHYWPYRENGKTKHIAVSGHFFANNPEVVRDAALAGLGVALLPTWLVSDDLHTGSLRAILTDYEVVANGLYAVTPTRRYIPQTTMLFINFLKTRLGPTPPWEASEPNAQPETIRVGSSQFP